MLFENKNIQKIFSDNGINIITLKNPLLSRFLKKNNKFSFKKFCKFINKRNDNILIFAIGPHCWTPIIQFIEKKNNIKIITWQDDPHILSKEIMPIKTTIKKKNILVYNKS